MPDEAEVWLRPYWGGFKWHLAVWSTRFAAHRARCNSTMELDDRHALASPKEKRVRCASCLRWGLKEKA